MLVAVVCVILALGVAAWRLVNPPINVRMKEELSDGAGYIRSCQFEDAFEAYRRAAALDGTDPIPQRGMEIASKGRRNFDQHRRFGKGCSVSVSDEKSSDGNSE